MRKLLSKLTLAAVLGLPGAHAWAKPAIRHVIVIAMENTDADKASSFWRRPRYLYGNPQAPYVNETLLPRYAHATDFRDPLPISAPSEPHYVWMEAGTNVFPDHTFKSDREPERENSTASGAHLVNQIEAAGLSWMTYQEGITGAAGACPVEEDGNYAPKHNPFIFFQDVSGDPPSSSAKRCAAHARPYHDFAGDLAPAALQTMSSLPPMCAMTRTIVAARTASRRETAGSRPNCRASSAGQTRMAGSSSWSGTRAI